MPCQDPFSFLIDEPTQHHISLVTHLQVYWRFCPGGARNVSRSNCFGAAFLNGDFWVFSWKFQIIDVQIKSENFKSKLPSVGRGRCSVTNLPFFQERLNGKSWSDSRPPRVWIQQMMHRSQMSGQSAVWHWTGNAGCSGNPLESFLWKDVLLHRNPCPPSNREYTAVDGEMLRGKHHLPQSSISCGAVLTAVSLGAKNELLERTDKQGRWQNC